MEEIFPIEDYKIIISLPDSVFIFPPEFNDYFRENPSLLNRIRKTSDGFINIGEVTYEKRSFRFLVKNEPVEIINLIPFQKDLSHLYSMIIHELKNPIAAVRAMVQVMKNGIETGAITREKQLGYLHAILEEIDRMNRILGSIIKLSKPTVRFTFKFDLVETIKKAISLWVEELKRTNIKIRLITNRKNIFFTGNPDEFHQILNNLLRNSREALEGRKNPVIEVELAEEKDVVVIQVRDNGRGMDTETLERVRSSFYSTKPDGLGLGLFVVKTLVRKNNGTIEIYSEPGKGTTVEMRFRRNAGNTDN